MLAPVRHSTRSYRSLIGGFELPLHCSRGAVAVENIPELVAARTVLVDRRVYLHVMCGWMSTGPNRSTTEGINLLPFREFDQSRCCYVAAFVNLLFTPVIDERAWMK